ncbi:MAG TPA: ATP-binding protein, partial [Cyclobacteriaceae bacterium]|nr:ATP-binding protein [Cyclobacteriaceae bacterium]
SFANLISAEVVTLQSLARERERAEALSQIDKAKTAFFSNISHEFRTPLTLMLSPLEQMLNDGQDLSVAQKQNLETSYRNSLRLQKLVNTLLDFSRIEAGKMEASFQAIDITAITRDLASSFRSAIEATGIEYNVSVRNISRPVAVDVDMWEKIVLNLISNAFKDTKKGKIGVDLYEEDDAVILKVSDSGVGIKEEHLQKVFERFYRIGDAGGRSQEGTGIGLSLVKELILLHDGDIEVQSEPGSGSTFTVKIPFGTRAITDSTPKTHSRASTLTRRAFVDEASTWNTEVAHKDVQNPDELADKPAVVVADDNSDMRDYIVRLLRHDYRVFVAGNGDDAFEIAMEAQPDLIISDIMMPKLDGFGLLKKLRSNLQTRGIPVIFLSARAGDEAKVEGIQAGADDYLVKPFSSRELLARVTNHIAANSARRNTEKEFFNLFVQSPAHIHVFKGPDHTVEFFHPLGKKIIGRDITGQKIRDAMPELKGQGYFELLDDVYQNGRIVSLPQSKAILPDEDGKPVERYFNITYVPWRDLEGKIQGVLQFSVDETEQALANMKIKESEERFRVLANSIPQFVWIADAAGKVEYISDQWENYSATSIETGIASFSSFIHPDDIGAVRERWKKSIATKQPWTSEFRLQNVKTGEYRWFLGHTVPLLDQDNNVIKWIGSSSDIHAQKTHSFELEGIVAERTSELIKLNSILKGKNEELSRAQNFLQTVLDSSVELVTAFDTQLNFTFVNKRLTTLSPRKPEELVGRNLLEVNPALEDTEGYRHLMRALQGETIHIEARPASIDRSLIFETFIIPLKQNGQVTGVVTMQRDITAMINLTNQLRESNEQLKRSNEDLQQFAHVTSHDLKEPVRKIRMYADILNNGFAGFLPDKGKDYLHRIDKATSRISAMIDGVLQYSIIDATDLAVQEIDLNKVVQNILEDLEILIKESGAQVIVQDLPIIRGYATLIHQLFYNLINNSLKFRRESARPEITLSFRESVAEPLAEYFELEIKDNGVGFEQAYAERVFESFTRLNPKDKYEGTGLGLALCRKIVQRHKGIIRAKSELNKGATFSIYFPKTILSRHDGISR